jgi:ribonuclease HI
MILSIFCDGGARGNPGPAAIAFLIKDNFKTIYKYQRFIGKSTNNVAEYTALINAYIWLTKNIIKIQPQPKLVNFFLDSKLIVNQLNGLYKVKNSNLRNLIIQIRQFENQIKTTKKYHFINREQNQEADFLVNLALNNATR